MNSDVKISISSLESEKNTIIATYKKQIEEFQHLKSRLENVEWYDEQYDRLIEHLNRIASAISDALHTLTNGREVYAINDVLYYAERYLDNETKFPKL